MVEMSSDWYWMQDEHFRFVEVAGLDVQEADTDVGIGKARWEIPASARCRTRSGRIIAPSSSATSRSPTFVFLRYNKAGELRYSR